MRELQPKTYWICDSCALKHQLTPFKTGNTLIEGFCGWCDSGKKEFLTPLRDLKTPEGKSGYAILDKVKL